MKRVNILSTVLSISLLTLAAACNNDNNNGTTDDGKIDATKGIAFKVNFADYNDNGEVNVTRANEKEVKSELQTVDLGNGILAQCTLQRDTTKQIEAAATRALPNDTYTMLAYDNATHVYKGSISGTVSGGVFTGTDKQDLILAPGNYDFVLYNSKVIRNGNNLTVNRVDADAAFIGRTTKIITTTPHKQEVAFTMKHVGAIVAIRLTSYMRLASATATLESINSTDVPGSSIYDAANDTWSMGNGVVMSFNTTFPTSGTISGKFHSNSNEEIIFMPATDVSKLKLTFKSGNIYNQNMANASLTFNPASTLKLEQNGVYVLNINLMYRFLYLMSDGTTGFITDTPYGGTGGTKTPIGIVISQSKRLAVALQNAGEIMYHWAESPADQHVQQNQNMKNSFMDLLALENGEEETWSQFASMDYTTIKALSTRYPACKAAGDYSPTLPAGVHITGTMVGKRWYLPALGEWKYVFSALGFGNTSTLTSWGTYEWYGDLADAAFTQVGGTTIHRGTIGQMFWSSSECYNDHAGVVTFWPQNIRWMSDFKATTCFVRPFIHF